MREKDQQPGGTYPSPQQPVAGSPSDFERAQNENPRANENIPENRDNDQETGSDTGAEITDGEDA